jgi:DNA polymerase
MIFLDTETYNDVPLKHGTYRYTSTCEVMIVTYAIDDAPPKLWDITAGDSMPGDLGYVLDDPDEIIVAHNAMFDRNAVKYSLGRDIPIARWRCSMAKALAHALPGGLDFLCKILGVPADLAKHKDGRRLIHLFCKPQPAGRKIQRATRETHPEDWKLFCDYALADITAMRDVWHKLPEWNYTGNELALYHLDQKINDRGIYVDVPFAEAAIKAVAREQKRLAKLTVKKTDGAVPSMTQRDQLLIHLVKEFGVDLPDLQKDTLERRIADPDLPIELRELLAIRLQVSSTSTSKYAALVRGVMPDSRLRGTLQFDGAARTRRWAGRTFQPQNLPRPDLPSSAVDFGIDAITHDCEDLLVDDVMRLTRNAIRGTIIAPPGRKLVVADLANIEGRAAAWLAGEDWKLDAFRAYDTILGYDAKGEPIRAGHDLYKVAYASSFNIRPEDVTKDQRQIGKVEELMLQYEGGVGAFLTGAATYGIDLDAMANAARPNIPDDIAYEANGMWDWCIKESRPTFGLSKHVFTTCDSIKRLWRRRHPATVATWPALKEGYRLATDNPGERFEVGKFTFLRTGEWLRLLMPSGNVLCYPSPRTHADGSISYMGMNQYTKKWSRIKSYGGKLFENICQGFSGDVLKHGMPPAEDAGYEIVLTVHDEEVTETPDTPEFSVAGLAAIMSTVPAYAPGLPLAAAGFETYRYRKD